MLKKDEQLIELFKKITQVHFMTDYSSIDFLYPPHFIWDKFDKNKFSKNKFCSGNYLLYAHFPFCWSKCKFCRQFSLASKNKKFYREYVNLLVRELNFYVERVGIDSFVNVYLGGGTPTLFPLENFFKAITPYFYSGSPVQINIESTPESLNRQKLKQLKEFGVSRLLIGIQSLDSGVLKKINRIQRKSHFLKVYHFAKEIGIPVINLELVAGLPGQTSKSFFKDLDDVIKLKPESIHIYGYMNCPATFFYEQNYQKSQKEKELQGEMIKQGQEMLSDANYFFQGDDYCLDNKSASRNLSLPKPNYSSGPKTLGQMSLGLSSIGTLSLENGQFIKTINTIDYGKYKENILKKEFPIEKEFLLNQDEKTRASLIRGYRHGALNIRREEKELYNLAFDFLKRQRKVKIRQNGKKVKIVFSLDESIVYSKVFYSPKVLKKCREVIEKEYPNIDSLDLSF